MSSTANNIRIAKNTGMLYFRMLLTMGISLYTVRIVLKVLGIEDYGTYNVVAGFVSMLSFLSQTMANATQRFLSVELGLKDITKLKQVFGLSITIYLIIAILLFILAETLGLWFVNYKLVISPDRLLAANWIYQFAILSFLVSIITIPYNAAILAREEMSIFAYISILEVTLKLVVVFILIYLPYDKLITYGMLMLLTTVIITYIFRAYSKKKFPECSFSLMWDKKLFLSIINYSSWTLFGTISGIANNQGNNILLNLFFGPKVNAARAIAFQVNSALNSFSSNFYMAVRPQIIKKYVEGDISYVIKLFFSSTKYSFFMLLVLCLPLILETEFILNLWLKNIGDYMVIFTQLILIYSMVVSLQSPITTVMQATGNIRLYHSIVDGFTLFSLPASYLFLKNGYPPQTTLYISIIIFSIAHFIRLYILNKFVKFNIKSYLTNVLLNIIIVGILSFILPLIIRNNLAPGLYRFIIVIFFSILSSILSIYFIGLNKQEKIYIIDFLKKVICLRKNLIV